MRGINRVFILGRLGHIPELKKTANGMSYTDLSIATHRPTRKGDIWEEKTDWHQVRTWENHAELCVRMLSKGSPLAIEGQLRTDSWLDSTGEKQFKTYIMGDRVHFLPTIKAVDPESA